MTTHPHINVNCVQNFCLSWYFITSCGQLMKVVKSANFQIDFCCHQLIEAPTNKKIVGFYLCPNRGACAKF